VYFLTWSGHHYSIDGIVMFQYAKSLLFDRSFVMDPPVRWGVDFSAGQWPIGLTLAYIPILEVLSLTIFRGNDAIRQIPYDPDLNYNLELLANRPYRFSSFLNPAITAASAIVLYGLCRQLGFSTKRAVAAALIFGLASPAAVYAKFDFAQPLASFFLMLTFYYFFRSKAQANANYYASGAFFGLAVLSRPELIVLSPILIGAAAFASESHSKLDLTRDRIRSVLSLLIPVLVFFFLNQLVNFLKFGSWTSFGYRADSAFTLSPKNIGTALIGNLISPGRGVLLFFPLGIMSILGLKRLFTTGRFTAGVYIALICSSLLMYSAWKDWGGGLSWGPRFFIPLIPYLTLLGISGFSEVSRRYRKPIYGILIIMGLLVTFQGLLFNYHDFYAGLDIPQPVLDQGNYNFLPKNSPILMGWSGLDQPYAFDIYWLTEGIIGSGEVRFVLVLFAGFFTLGYALKWWVDFFRAQESG
jgi:hypothetical protein